MRESWAKKSAQNYALPDIFAPGLDFLRMRGVGRSPLRRDVPCCEMMRD